MKHMKIPAGMRGYGSLLSMLILISIVCLGYGQQKGGMFIDEIYTYGLANSTKGAFLRDLMDDTGGGVH